MITMVLVGGGMVSLGLTENILASKGKLAEAEIVRTVGFVIVLLGSGYGLSELFKLLKGFMGVMMW